MAFELTFDMSDFEKFATQKLGAAIDQIPYAMALTLNDSVFAARRVLTESTWPSHVQVRSACFISAALRVLRATKSDLTVAIYDRLGRGNLALHAKGGVSGPKTARRFAIPSPEIRRGARGVVSRDKVRALIDRYPRRSLRVTKTGVYLGVQGRLKLLYRFAPSVVIKRDVTFAEDFAYTMTQEIAANFSRNIARAMATRR
jgi:hypothetical protein